MPNKNDTIERLRDIRDRAVVSDGMFTERAAYMVKLIDDALDLLKEQEPVKPYAQGDGSFACDNCGETVGWEEMNCGGISMIKYKFCPECGRAITWD